MAGPRRARAAPRGPARRRAIRGARPLSRHDELAAAYADALRGFLLAGGEGQLTAAYEMGRRAVADGLTVLELSDLHHDALAAAMAGVGGEQDARRVVDAGRDLLREALSAFEMVRRGFDDAREQALAARHDAAMIRRLAELLSDAPPAADGSWRDEVAWLLAEGARHLCRSTAAVITIGDGADAVVAAEHDPGDGAWAALLGEPEMRRQASSVEVLARLDGSDLAADPLLQRLAVTSEAARSLTGWLVAPMRGTDGRRLGTIELFATAGSAFSEVDADVARHLALLAANALERGDRPAGAA
ncbi:MAG TPA: phosphatase RsbU N-terminal domain-containing protein [Miltoncostaea sp.]|nr:phosphatase RsbU N-terminal domain-containing protein [Miltoncostaea sp.]